MKKFIIYVCTLVLFLSIGTSCNKEDEACIENIKEDCMCITIYQPVCGCNGNTYGNACVAECSGITEFTLGACEELNTQ